MNNSITTCERQTGKLLKFPVTKARRARSLKGKMQCKVNHLPAQAKPRRTPQRRKSTPRLKILAAHYLIEQVANLCDSGEVFDDYTPDEIMPFMTDLEDMIGECKSKLFQLESAW